MDTFTLNIDGLISPDQKEYLKLISRTVEGLSSCLLALKKQPIVRASRNSRMCQNLVSELQSRISQEQNLFDFKKTDNPPLLLILDRADDPITPLLTQWTYQAMVHDLFGLSNNRVNLKKSVPGVKKDLEVSICFISYSCKRK